MTRIQLLQLCISSLLMAVTIVIPARLVLRVEGLPVGRALIIAFASNALGKVLVSFVHLPPVLSYSLPTLVFFVLSWLFFRPTITRLLLYWLLGFAIYLAIHALLGSFLGWDFMFPFWRVRLLG